MSQVSGEYEFTVSEIVNGETKYLPLQIRLADDRAQRFYKDIWGKMSGVVKNFHDFSGDGLCPSWTAWQVFNWSKQVVPERTAFVAWDDDAVVGFLNIRSGFGSQFDQAKPILYIEHLAAAPGCLSTRLWKRTYGRVGTALLAFAIHQASLRNGSGLVGFHVADDTAKAWYEALNTKYSLFQPSKAGVSGPHESDKSKAYLETIPSGGLSLLEEYRNE